MGENRWSNYDKNEFDKMKEEWKKGNPGGPSGIRTKFATNAQTKTHAEADAFWHLYKYRKENKLIGGEARLVVDRDLCASCGRNKGVMQLVEEVGLDKLTVITPSGRETILPRPENKRTSW